MENRVQLSVGQHVDITKGDWKGLSGEILNITGNVLKLEVVLRSRRRLVILDKNSVKE